MLKNTLIFFKSLSISCVLVLMTAFMQPPLTQDEAIKLAETFVRENGYTSLLGDTSKLSYELFDNEYTKAEILKRRQNALHPKAFCISEAENHWNIGFLSTIIELDKLDSIEKQTNLEGRSIIVSKDGENIRMAHKTPLFSRFKKL